MENICGVFASAEAAAWVQGIGSLAAIGVAIWLYFRGRGDAAKREAARRTVLFYRFAPPLLMLFQQVRDNHALVSGRPFTVAEARRMKLDVEMFAPFLDGLVQHGTVGDEKLAAFLDLCRYFNHVVDVVADLQAQDLGLIKEHAMVLKTALDRCSAIVDSAIRPIRGAGRGQPAAAP
jgi:hypothetical protein